MLAYLTRRSHFEFSCLYEHSEDPIFTRHIEEIQNFTTNLAGLRH
jgi:hypothetical protein